MKNTNLHRSRLVGTYLLSFLLLVVAPLLVVMLAAISLLRAQMLESALQKIDLAQTNVVGTLTNDINAATLKLAQILNAADGAALELAGEIVTAEGQQKHAATQQLKQLYSFAVAPSSNIIALHFYGYNGEVQYIKDALTVPLETLRQEPFYQQAVATPGRTHVSNIRSNITYMDKASAKTRMAIVVAFAPLRQTARDAIELACLYVNTHANVEVQQYSREPGQGDMCMVSEAGELLIAPEAGQNGFAVPQALYTAAAGRYRYREEGRTVQYVVAPIPQTQWRVVTRVDNHELLGGFNSVAGMIIAVALLLFGLFIGFSIIFLRNIIAPVNHLVAGMAAVETGDLTVRLAPQGQADMRRLTESFNRMVATTGDLLESNRRQQQERHQAEMEALQSQINPHFLVNTLGSIRFIAMAAKFDSIMNMAEALMKILSGSFRHAARLYSFGEELDMLRSYIYLMGVRYSGNFEVIYDIADDCLGLAIPRLTLQPLVENAIVHGFDGREEPGTITIAARREEKNFILTITDDGQGMTQGQVAAILASSPTKEDRNGIGVANVRRRIQLNFGPDYGLTLCSTPGKGTVAGLILPAIPLQPTEQEDKKCTSC